MGNVDESQNLENGNSDKNKKKKIIKRKGKKYTQIAEDEYYDIDDDDDENNNNNNNNERNSSGEKKSFKYRESPEPDASSHQETANLLNKKAQPLEKIEFNNTREARISRVNLGPVQQLPPQLDIHVEKKIPWKRIMTNVGVLTMYTLKL